MQISADSTDSDLNQENNVKTTLKDQPVEQANSNSNSTSTSTSTSIHPPSSRDSRHDTSSSVAQGTGAPDDEAEVEAEEDEDDWLMSDEEIQQPKLSNPASSLPKVKSMADRDWGRVDTQFKDAGYREGITAGKLSTLQAGFDSGFNLVGAPLGSQLGRLRGEASAMKVFLESQLKNQLEGQVSTPARAEGSRMKVKKSKRPSSSTTSTIESHQEEGDPIEGKAKAALELEIEDLIVISGSSTETGSECRSIPRIGSQPIAASEPSSRSGVEESLRDLISLLSTINRITLSDLEPPDYEALKHEKEHLEGRADEIRSGEAVGDAQEVEDDGIKRETDQERLKREGILGCFEKRLIEIESRVFQ